MNPLNKRAILFFAIYVVLFSGSVLCRNALLPPGDQSIYSFLLVLLPLIPLWLGLWNLADGVKAGGQTTARLTAARLLKILVVLQLLACPIVLILLVLQ